jgi:hypothetical protein
VRWRELEAGDGRSAPSFGFLLLNGVDLAVCDLVSYVLIVFSSEATAQLKQQGLLGSTGNNYSGEKQLY